MTNSIILLSLMSLIGSAHALLPLQSRRVYHRQRLPGVVVFVGGGDDDNSNPYADENYPDLEFINYDDPEYVVNQGEVFQGEDDTEEQIEAMREYRRRRNDEFQFETYYAKTLQGGKPWNGEFTVYETSTFLDEKKTLDEYGLPKIRVRPSTILVASVGSKKSVETKSDWRVDGERIRHEETAQDGTIMPTYWPEEMSSYEFRGVQGNMCVGNAYSICTALPLLLDEDFDEYTGPFGDMRTEIGIFDNGMRFRVKFDYSVKDIDRQNLVGVPPPLHLKTMTVCRETVDVWPDSETTPRLFHGQGAPGGLYDPPPVGGDDQASKYMMLDLEGGATVLFPYQLDQDPRSFNGNGWVTSLDWTPGMIRYQVDRKVLGGEKMLGLRTLELSEVQASQADQWRPKDGGSDMRQ